VDDRPRNPDELMENQTSFDLNAAMHRWRESLGQSPEFRIENIDELESHVQDSISDLQGRGLSAEEAFVIATRRVGSGAALAAEFAQVNGQALWIDRGLWMLVGWAVISGFESLSRSSAMFTINPRMFPVPFLPLLTWMLPILVGAILLRSLIRAQGVVPRLLGKLQWRPTALALMAIGAGASSVLLRVLAWNSITGDGLHRELAISSLIPLVEWVLAAVVILFLARKKLRLAKG
jgi:hypothetical protein